MASPLRDLLKNYGNRAELYGERVLITLHYKASGGKYEAKQNARRMVMGFASLRQHERIKVRKRCDLEGLPYPDKLPFEDVHCYSIDHEDYLEVIFAPRDSDELALIYEDTNVKNDVASAPVEPNKSRLMELAALEKPNEPRKESTSLFDLPQGMNPFTGKPLEES